MTLKNPYHYLSKKDKDLARVYKVLGTPPDWQREPGFATLVQIILEQQVSLASAKATFEKLAKYGNVTPENLIVHDDTTLKACGFSRQKIRYTQALAKAIINGFDLEHLQKQDDTTIRAELIKLPGIGNWTLDIYLLMALKRPDILPVGDLALQIAVKEVKHLPQRPTSEEMFKLAEPWQPYRSYSTKLLWHYYLSRKSNHQVQP